MPFAPFGPGKSETLFGALLLVFAVLLAELGWAQQSLGCARDQKGEGTCTFRNGGFFRAERRWPVSSLVEARHVGGLGKNHDRGEVQVIFTSGHQLTLFRARDEESRRLHAALGAFLNSKAPRTLAIEASPEWMLRWLSVGVGLGGIITVIRARRRAQDSTRAAGVTPPEADRCPSKKPSLLLWTGLIPVALVAVVLFFWIVERSQGRLIVRCQHRCRFGTAECLPGGHFEGTHPPGRYSVQVWNPAVPGHWETHEINLEAGQIRTFVCRPGSRSVEKGSVKSQELGSSAP